ncbi:MAG: hypothetical protein M1837_004745 [Sclerophora amabilis]|nr:MAG: hypothetical protein M1837_004745 [Sclerophora amabilis]
MRLLSFSLFTALLVVEDSALVNTHAPSPVKVLRDTPIPTAPPAPPKPTFFVREQVRGEPWLAWLELPIPTSARKRYVLNHLSIKLMATVAAKFVMKLDFAKETFHETTYIPNIMDTESPTLEPWHIRIDWHNFKPPYFTYRYSNPANRLVVKQKDYTDAIDQRVDTADDRHPALPDPAPAPAPGTVFDNRTLDQWIYQAVWNRDLFGTAVSGDSTYWIQFRVFSDKSWEDNRDRSAHSDENADAGNEDAPLCRLIRWIFHLWHPQVCRKHLNTNVEDVELQPLLDSTRTCPDAPASVSSTLPGPTQSPDNSWIAWLSILAPDNDDNRHYLNRPTTRDLANEAAMMVMGLDFSRENFTERIHSSDGDYASSSRWYVQIDWINSRHTPENFGDYPAPNRLVIPEQMFRPSRGRGHLPRETLGQWISDALRHRQSTGTVTSERGDLSIRFQVLSLPPAG